MATEVKAWRAEDGSLHGSEREAATANVRNLVEAEFPHNDPSVNPEMVIEWLTRQREPVMRVLATYHRCHPANMPKAEAPPEAKKGPAETGPDERPPVPADETHGDCA